MNYDFGMKTDNLERARRLIERVTGLTALDKEHVDLGGRYYEFEGPSGESIIVLRNIDIYDLEPLVDGLDDCPIVVLVENGNEASPIMRALLQEREHLNLRRAYD